MLPSIFDDLEGILISIGLDILVTMVVIDRLRAVKLLNGMMRYVLLLFNMLILLFCYALTKMDLSVGAGLGLFALLGILRIRSEIVKIEEVIGLLILMGLGFLHSIYPQVLQLWEILLVDCVILGISALLGAFASQLFCIRMKLENLELLHPGHQKDLHELIEKNFGMSVKNVTILSINLEDNTANLNVTLCERPLPVQSKVRKLPEKTLSDLIKTI